ncbi:alpha-amylase [bacterium]|nr:alpha-amylase [candidate division CSSED10-310 bacterium]
MIEKLVEGQIESIDGFEGPVMMFHVSRESREKYKFDRILFASSGSVIFADFHSARIFASKMNEFRDLLRYPEKAVRASQINALGVLDEIYHSVVAKYRRKVDDGAIAKLLAYVNAQLGAKAVDEILLCFTEEFPPPSVFQNDRTGLEYLNAYSHGVPNREVRIEELIMLHLNQSNTAAENVSELFESKRLKDLNNFHQMFDLINRFFREQPAMKSDGIDLIEFLKTPSRRYPGSLEQQLLFIRDEWQDIIGEKFKELISGLDFIHEEEKPVFGGPGPSLVVDYKEFESEPEGFSRDLDWMPRLVLIAKNIYVWLDQLSKKYRKSITRLDQIPVNELETLSNWGFTGIWLIGVWERSNASQRIKQLCGNPEAVASAYSIYDYRISNDLGGDDALEKLKQAAWQYGIRLASDMVPNHMGIDSRWVLEHPDWFIYSSHCPFPSYTFNGPDLSPDPAIGIYLEDHYYTRSDAAVVFKRIDRRNDDIRYIYHGNDGTDMPWNDTAQLNFLDASVREAVLGQIKAVASRFPIIRFDAAMTLAKRHFQRLWFPEPGRGGAIPSRAEFSMTKSTLDQFMPQEFWREVVDRISEEIPDTLLLAEAFWLMEGYFVRTLGMHRVYNSAFMNMLRDEDNEKYHEVIRNTMMFDPDILKRFVNFMNNPDERTAIEQFGRDQKYFAVCTMMATLPGLPMIGHGQIEGFREKYGMEYRQAYLEEKPDQELMDRHIKEIFPIFRKRHLFADVMQFRFYEFHTPDGAFYPDVFAYSNRKDDQAVLVIIHNRYTSIEGTITRSSTFVEKYLNDTRNVAGNRLHEGLGINGGANVYCSFKDSISGLIYLRRSQDLIENGIYWKLEAYEYCVLQEFTEFSDSSDGLYSRLLDFLGDRGATDLKDAILEMNLQPVWQPFTQCFDSRNLNRWISLLTNPECTARQARVVTRQAGSMFKAAFNAITRFYAERNDSGELSTALASDFLKIYRISRAYSEKRLLVEQTGNPSIKIRIMDFLLKGRNLELLIIWFVTKRWGSLIKDKNVEQYSRFLYDDLRFDKFLLGLNGNDALSMEDVNILKMLISPQKELRKDRPFARTIQSIFQNGDVRSGMKVNRFDNVLWFGKEVFEVLMDWWMVIFYMENITVTKSSKIAHDTQNLADAIDKLKLLAEQSGYKVFVFLDSVTATYRNANSQTS